MAWLAMSLGLGPAGFIGAVFVGLFAVSWAEYQCPVPPPEQFAYTNHDLAIDQADYPWPKGDVLLKKYYQGDYANLTSQAGCLGLNQTQHQSAQAQFLNFINDRIPSWQTKPSGCGNGFYVNGIGFNKGDDSRVWQFWSRFYVGQLLQATAIYGVVNEDLNKPRQVVTYRKANVAYLNSESIFAEDDPRWHPSPTQVFGEIEKNNSFIGFGYSQESSKITDWIHVGFGGWR